MAVNILSFDEVAVLLANKSIDEPNFASVSFSIELLNELKEACNVEIVDCFFLAVSRFAFILVNVVCFTETNASTQELVSSPEPKPLNVIVGI